MFKKLFVGLILLAAPSSALADTLIKLSLGNTGPDFTYSGGVLSTFDDGVAGTPGLQDTGIDFVGAFDGPFTDILANASFSVSGVTASGNAATLGPIITQATSGGIFSIWDDVGTLILTGNIGTGAITGSSTGNTGSFFNTSSVTFTGGSLFPFLVPNSGGISFALANIISAGNPDGLLVVNDQLQSFTSDADGLITGNPIPEPMTILLVGPALFGLARRRRQ